MKSCYFYLLPCAWLAASAARAQEDIPLLSPEEQASVEKQTAAFNDAITPALKEAAKSTVRIWGGQRRVAYGTVIGNGRQILTKWSEISRVRAPLTVSADTETSWSAKITGVYENEDLAVLEIQGNSLPPVRWHESPLKPGSFLAAPQPDGRLAAFGVVSVPERNLRQTDSAYLGIGGAIDFGGPGVKIESVAKDSGAATAGVRPGDIILQIGDRPISGLLELRNSLVGLQPGSKVTMHITRGGNKRSVEITLGNRPDLPNFPGDRLQAMERMGGPISRVRDSFSAAVQSDMRPKPDQIGGPVVDLQGHVVGVTLARADRTRSFIMPAAAIQNLLKNPAADPSVAKIRRTEPQTTQRVSGPIPQPEGELLPPQPLNEDRIRMHLEHMQRLMDSMRSDLDDLELSR